MNDSEAFSKYLTYSDRDVQWQIYCTCVGYSRVPPGARYPFRPKQHPPGYFFKGKRGRVLNEYQIIYISRGSGLFQSENAGIINIKEGSMFMVFPGERHTYRPNPDIGWDEYWVGFRGNYPELLHLNGFFTEEEPVLHPGLQDSIIEGFHELFEIARRETPGFQPKLGGATIKLLARTLSFIQQQEHGSGDENLIRKARCLFEENIYNSIEMNDFAGSLGMDYSEFRRIFKSYTGMSPYQYFLHLKINKAKDLIAAGEYSIKEIAYMLSFENQYYFSRLFKSKTGVPPSRWHT